MNRNLYENLTLQNIEEVKKHLKTNETIFYATRPILKKRAILLYMAARIFRFLCYIGAGYALVLLTLIIVNAFSKFGLAEIIGGTFFLLFAIASYNIFFIPAKKWLNSIQAVYVVTNQRVFVFHPGIEETKNYTTEDFVWRKIEFDNSNYGNMYCYRVKLNQDGKIIGKSGQNFTYVPNVIRFNSSIDLFLDGTRS